MKKANNERRKNAEKENLRLGKPWIWKPGFSLPLKSQGRAMQSSENERIEIVESLFVGDTTIIGKKNEIFKGRDIVVEVMSRFKEKSHPGRGTCILWRESKWDNKNNRSICSREKDTQERLKRDAKQYGKWRKDWWELGYVERLSCNCGNSCWIISIIWLWH